MSSLRLSLLVVVPVVAVVVAASCSPVERPPFEGAGGTGGGSSSTTTTLSGMQTTGAVMTTSGTDATTSGMPSTSAGPCADTLTDPSNCGGCGHDCSQLANPGVATCANGLCVFTCSGGFLDCTMGAEDGCETDPASDPKNCSACGVPCGLTQSCAASACADTFTSCDMLGTCHDPSCEDLNRFSVDADIAVDVQNGHSLWTRLTKGPLDFTAATDYCATGAFGGVSGWRLPTVLELADIVHGAGGQDGCGAPNCDPAIDQAVFGDTISDDYWTSDVAPQADSHFCVNFCTGFQFSHSTTEHYYVRCIHDPIP
jgi:uncharacterized protein DUF1566